MSDTDTDTSDADLVRLALEAALRPPAARRSLCAHCLVNNEASLDEHRAAACEITLALDALDRLVGRSGPPPRNPEGGVEL